MKCMAPTDKNYKMARKYPTLKLSNRGTEGNY